MPQQPVAVFNPLFIPVFLLGNGRYVVERVSDYVSRLHVVRVQQVDTGVYVCTVGMLRASFTLTIEGRF